MSAHLIRRFYTVDYQRSHGGYERMLFGTWRRPSMIVWVRCSAVSYFGTVSFTRSETVLTRLPRVAAIGFRHRRMREFGDGWQVLGA